MNIGIIGMSPGNAHPYSWSSIINGVFDVDEITKAGYPAVAAYLKANEGTLGIPGAQVTHVWCQERTIAESIARSSGIGQVVNQLEDLIGQVDAIILARDDPENHLIMARPFIEAGMPIFIDKPLAVTYDELNWYAGQQAAGKFIFSCSSMRYANECLSAKTELANLGNIRLITAVGKKDWKKYGVHMVEAVFAILNDPEPLQVQYAGETDQDIVLITFKDGIKASVHLFMDISSTFQFTIFGEKGWRLVDIKNSYSMFRDTIIEFLRSAETGKPRLAFEKTRRVIQTIAGAIESKENGGKIISLTERL